MEMRVTVNYGIVLGRPTLLKMPAQMRLLRVPACFGGCAGVLGLKFLILVLCKNSIETIDNSRSVIGLRDPLLDTYPLLGTYPFLQNCAWNMNPAKSPQGALYFVCGPCLSGPSRRVSL